MRVTVGALLLLACAKRAVVDAGAQTITLEVQPAIAQVVEGGTVAFTAVVTGAASATINWNVVEAGGGTIDGAGLYTAPQTTGTFHVHATTPVDATVQSTGSVTVLAPGQVAVTVSPSTGAVHSCQTLVFRATVTGASDSSVTWSVQEGAAGGTIDANGNYTAPGAPGAYHVVATSHADPARSAVAQVNVTDQVLSVAVSPPAANLGSGKNTQFTATVTTSCGTFAAARPTDSPGVPGR